MKTLVQAAVGVALAAVALLIAVVALTLVAVPAPAQEARESALRLETPTGALHGTLLLPAGGNRVPVALIIAGSGPTDRDGNSRMLPGKNNSLKLLAELLAEHGVASLRYDKRGIGASASAATSEADLRFGTYVDDAVAWIGLLATDPRFRDVMVVGHSEGSLLGIMAAQRAGVSKVISLAGAGRTAADVLDEQLAKQLPETMLADARRVIAELKEGRTVTDAPPQLAALFRPSVQPYLISWLTLDPAAEAAKLTVPLLVVQGTTDVQVGVADAERLAGKGGTSRLEVIEGMNHVLKEVTDPAKQAASYSDPTLPLHPRLRAVIATFLR